VVAASFGVIVLAEWGDLTQLATAGIAASTGRPVEVAIGALLALWSVAALASVLGRAIVARLPVHRLQRIAALIFAGLAALTLVELL
jgi:putative Ca2+/H+ antiporter (TMEM165/GDT1 family)